MSEGIKLTLDGDGRSDEDWRKLLYYHAIKVTQAKTKDEMLVATRALRAVSEAAKSAGFDPEKLRGDPGPAEWPSERAARIARDGTDLRPDQLMEIDDDVGDE